MKALWNVEGQELHQLRHALTLDERDGSLFVEPRLGEDMFFTTEIAPDFWLYIERKDTPEVHLSIGIFHRPRAHMVAMVRNAYPQYYAPVNRLQVPVDLANRVVALSASESAAHQQAALTVYQPPTTIGNSSSD
jgi:hypothetical protein